MHILGAFWGDSDLDGEVEFSDFVVLSDHFGQNGLGWRDGDFDGDGEVGFRDYVLLSENFGKSRRFSNLPFRWLG